MDYTVYSIKTISEEKIGELIQSRQSFVLEDVGRLNMPEAASTLEKVIESKGMKCRVYTKGRIATLAATVATAPPVVIGGLVAGIAIGAHNLATWNPDYEIAKNPATGALSVTYMK